MKTGLGLIGMLLFQLTVSAVPIATTTYGGDTFELFAGNLTWTAAEASAVADGGCLAVLTTAAQTTAVYNGLIGNGFFQTSGNQSDEAWLGAVPADGSHSTTSPGNWAWVDGSTWTSFDTSNFHSGEPSGDSEGLAINRYGDSTFNDEGSQVGGYIVEIPGVPDSDSALAMLGASFLTIGAIRRKFGK